MDSLSCKVGCNDVKFYMKNRKIIADLQNEYASAGVETPCDTLEKFEKLHSRFPPTLKKTDSGYELVYYIDYMDKTIVFRLEPESRKQLTDRLSELETHVNLLLDRYVRPGEALQRYRQNLLSYSSDEDVAIQETTSAGGNWLPISR